MCLSTIGGSPCKVAARRAAPTFFFRTMVRVYTRGMSSDLRQRIYTVVRTIPCGAVTSYGAVARRVGCDARQVGYAMAALPSGSDVPWHRVLNARGEISIPGNTGVRQRALLVAEGVTFDARGRVDFARDGWDAVCNRTEMEARDR